MVAARAERGGAGCSWPARDRLAGGEAAMEGELEGAVVAVSADGAAGDRWRLAAD